MKKRFILTSVLLCILCVMSTIIVGIATNVFGGNDENIYNLYSESDNKNDYIQYDIRSGVFEISEKICGEVEYNEKSLVVVSKAMSDVNREIICKIGQSVKKNEVLCRNASVIIKSPVNGKVIAIDDSEQLSITIVDFSESLIRVSISEKYQDIVGDSTVIFGSYNNAERIPMKICKIAPIIYDGKFDIFLINEFETYDMTNIDIEICYGRKEEAVFVDKECVFTDENGDKYINLLNLDKTMSKRYITIGAESDSLYEIIDGESLVGKMAYVDKEELILKESE